MKGVFDMKTNFTILVILTLLLSSCTPIATLAPTEPPAQITKPPANVEPITLTSTPAPSPTPLWYWANSLVYFTDMSILPNNEAWIASSHGLVMQKCLVDDCHSLSPYSTHTLDYYCGTAIDFLSANDGWLIGCPIGIYHWDGTKWEIQRPNDKKRALLDIGFATPNNGWAVGYIHEFHLEAVILHWDGTEWQETPLLDDIGRNDFSLNTIDVVSENNVWVAGGTVLHWNGTKWQEILLPKYMQELENIDAINETDVWVAGRGFVIHWDGHNWTATRFDSYIDNVLAVSPDNVWAAGAALYHWDGKQWSNAHYDEGRGNSIEKMTLTPDGSVWALTNSGNIYLLRK
jgi:hypothetical protein